jgi:hypothetical protein
MKKLFIWRTVWSNSWWHYRPQSDNTTCSMKGKGDRTKQHQSTAIVLRSLCTIWKHVAEWRYGSTHLQKNWDEWSVSGAGRIYRWERASDTYWIWGWVPSSIPEQVRTFCRREISTLSGTEPRFFSRPVHKIVTITDRRSKIISTWNRANVDRTVCTGHLTTSTHCWMYVSFPCSAAFYFIFVISATQLKSNSSFWISSVSHAPATAVSRGCLRYLQLAGMPAPPSELLSERKRSGVTWQPSMSTVNRHMQNNG